MKLQNMIFMSFFLLIIQKFSYQYVTLINVGNISLKYPKLGLRRCVVTCCTCELSTTNQNQALIFNSGIDIPFALLITSFFQNCFCWNIVLGIFFKTIKKKSELQQICFLFGWWLGPQTYMTVHVYTSLVGQTKFKTYLTRRDFVVVALVLY